MTTTALEGYTVYRHLRAAGVPLCASQRFGAGIGAALWRRNETAFTRYGEPSHHTLSLYVEGGEGIRRRRGASLIGGGHAGSLCLMPAGITTDWDVSGRVRMFHFYIAPSAFERVASQALEADPARVRLRDETFFRDPYLEAVIRSAVMPLDWEETADRLAIGHAAQMLLAYLAARFTEAGSRRLAARGGLAPARLRRVLEFVEAHLACPLSIEELAAAAELSPYHFARMFKRTTGRSPHGFVLERRVERGKALIATGELSLAEIALACGFSGQSHFTARFRTVTGVTPGRYAEALGSAVLPDASRH